ncbi:MAG: hypothetical protein VYD57_04410 [Pseudomonadota bacterium]|nr:hypothetical protein [Pseudomonadota bacterium]
MAIAGFSGCATSGGGSVSSLATNGNLSVEAIRIQSASETLMSYQAEQKSFRERETSFAVQGGILGAGAGAALGVGARCLLAGIAGGRCSKEDMIVAGVAGAAAGGVYGANKGREVAQRQNAYAKRENVVKRRIALASRQLSTAETARRRAESVLASNRRKLARLRKDVAAGRATRDQLATARADAAADAEQIRLAAQAMDSSADSLSSSESDIGRRLAGPRRGIQSAQSKTQYAYSQLVSEIGKSAL